MPSNAEALFDKIMAEQDRAAFLSNMVNSTPPTFEQEWLDFKSGCEGPESAARDLPDEKVKEIWSEALSGFANTGGGVLIFGIDARRQTNEFGKMVDAASDFRPVPNPDSLRSQLMALNHMATDPPVSGLRVESISGGFVVCLIPESSIKPHRAEYSRNKPYFFRVGDDFVVAPVALLRSLFYPHPVFQFRISAEWWPATASRKRIKIAVRNEGASTPMDLYIVAKVQYPSQACVIIGADPLVIYNVVDGDSHTFSCDKPLHPGLSMHLTTFEVETQGYCGGIGVFLTLHARDIPPRFYYLSVNGYDFIHRTTGDGTFNLVDAIPEWAN